MKKIKKLPVLVVFALIALLTLCVYGLTGEKVASADAYDYYGTYLSAYKITYDVNSNRSMRITEDITVSFRGNSGVIRYIPVNAGEKIKNVDVHEITDGTERNVYYDASLDSSFLTLDIGDSAIKYEPRTYRIEYDYCLTKAQEGKNLLALTPVGADWPCRIENIEIELKLPDGYIDGSAVCFVNNEFNKVPVTSRIVDGKTVINAKISYIGQGSEVRFDASFENGALSTYFDFTPYIFALAGLSFLAALIVLKLFVFNRHQLTPVVNYEAPNKMDPLIMGKLIDNKVNSEDVTSLIYYWAGKGYVKINLDDENDPTIIRVIQNLPKDSPSYEKLMYGNLFSYGDAVKTSQLKYSFYRTVEQVTGIVNKQTKGLYDSKSIGISVLFAILGGLLLGLAPFLLAFFKVSTKIIMFAPFIAIIPSLLIYAFTETVMYYRLKYKKSRIILLGIGVALCCAAVGALYVLLVPTCLMSYGSKIALFIVCALIFTCAVMLISRTKEYTEKLNDIIGFKNFIMLAEKDQLEMMLEEDPQFYYHILPYAQVLGVTDKWEEKFASITIEPPQWLTGNLMTSYIEFRILNSMMRNSLGKISSGMVSRPSSSGRSGGSHGGHFGGFSGGGHGGGGGSFR